MEDNITAKIIELNNEYKQLMDTDWWLMSIILTIELTALPLIFVLILVIFEYKSKCDLIDSEYKNQLKSKTKIETVFPQPSPHTFKFMSENWSTQSWYKNGYSGSFN